MNQVNGQIAKRVPLLRGPAGWPDTPLVSLARAHDAISAQRDAAGSDVEWEVLTCSLDAIEDLMVAYPSRTPADLAIKLRVCWRVISSAGESPDAPNDDWGWDQRMIASAITDAERMAGVAPVGAAPAVAAA